jgi:membrane fusion protein (multidrug efflux system)
MAAGPANSPAQNNGPPQDKKPAEGAASQQGQHQNQGGQNQGGQGGQDQAEKDNKPPPPKEPEKPKKPSPLKNPVVLVIGAIVLAIVLIGLLLFWLDARRFQSTDDAFVDVQIVRVAPQIQGLVTQVLVDDNQPIKAGQPLVKIDSAQAQTQVADAQAKRAQAQSQVDNALAQISVAQAGYEQALADVAAAKAQADNANADLNRYLNLQRTNPAAVAQQQLDQAQAQARSTAAQQIAAVKAARAKADQVTAAKTQVVSGREQVKAAEAELSAARINLGYAGIVAPVAGTIAQKTVAAGNYVQPGTQLMAIVPLNVWITANFKETQLDLMRAHQPVTVKVDACPHAKIQGHVDSIQRGAGQAFAILPPENATGNYVKVVQRVPVKIVLDNLPKDCPLGPGMSVEPRVKVR